MVSEQNSAAKEPSNAALFDKRKARPSELIDTNELARRLSVHPMTIRRWRREGKVKPYVIGGYAIRYDYVQVLAALANIPDERG